MQAISHIELRTEDAMDVRQYVHSRDIDLSVIDLSEEILSFQVFYIIIIIVQ